jgi:phospholipid/cholesterol/gamma-HCH transport system substrate-binding protein
MISRGFFRGRSVVGLAAGVAVLLAVVVGLALWPLEGPERVVTAYFSRAVGIYEGSDVRILGVKVGEIRAVVPQGRSVRVVMEYDARYRVPAGARAVIVPPSLVSDRYVQLAPAYQGGPVLPDGAELPLGRGVAPLELDDVYTALDELARMLGPNGANSTGELSRLLTVGRENLEGNGERLGDSLRDLSNALETLSDGRGDLFGTVDNLHRFTKVLADSDREVRRFNTRLADVAEQLASERAELLAALRNLGIALREVTRFVKENRAELVRNVEGLTEVSTALVRQRAAMIDVLDIAPTGLQNLALSYNAKSGTTDSRANLTGPYDPAGYVCSLMVHVLPSEEIPGECFALARRLHDSDMPLTPELGKLLGLSVPAPDRRRTDADRTRELPLPSGEVRSQDPTFGGILGGLR